MNKIIKLTIADMAADFLYYDRKEDYELPVGKIEDDLLNGLYTIDDIVNEFKKHLIARINDE